MSGAFERYAPFLRRYIYARGWENLYALQEAAAEAFFASSAHILIATPTASGKTEAAFFPMLTDMAQRPPQSIGILYISPLKALINDQFERMSDVLRDAEVPIWHWHGDVSAGHKRRALRDARGILQITPESLEALLARESLDVTLLFGELRYVVIDEVHAFLGQERGMQVQCLLARIERLCGCAPRRVGLSATLGDYAAACAYLSGGTKQEVRVVEGDLSSRKLRLALEHFRLPEPEEGMPEDPDTAAYWAELYRAARGRKAILFTNSRAQSEESVAHLRAIAAANHEPDIYHVHHGSLSAMLRKEAEAALRADGPAVAAATRTLELGIDIGDLQRIIQIGAPFSVSSFVQRLGRAGRRTGEAEMIFFCTETAPLPLSPVEALPWDLLRAVAIIELYLKERWIESPTHTPLPLSLCYHQTLCILRAQGAMRPADLARAVLTLPPFREVPREMYRGLLRHWLEIGHIERMEDGDLILGMEAERAVNHYSFLAVFPDEESYTVWGERGEVGTLSTPPLPGETFLLSGRTWRVVFIDEGKKRVTVEEAQGEPSAVWAGKGAEIDGRIVGKMREVLASQEGYAYLKEGAMGRVWEARKAARAYGLLSRLVVPSGRGFAYLLPWSGSRVVETLYRLLGHGWKRELGVTGLYGRRPYWLGVRVESVKALERYLEGAGIPAHADAYLGGREVPVESKFDEFLPEALCREAFVRNRLDVEGLVACLRGERAFYVE